MNTTTKKALQFMTNELSEIKIQCNVCKEILPIWKIWQTKKDDLIFHIETYPCPNHARSGVIYKHYNPDMGHDCYEKCDC